MKPRIEYFKNLGIPEHGVVKMIVKHPHLLHYSFEGLEEHINFLFSLLNERGGRGTYRNTAVTNILSKCRRITET